MLPFGALTLHGAKRKPYKDNPETLGEHLRKRRHKLGLFQKDVALRLGVNQWTYITWELETRQPSVRYMPAILSFLGYDPFPEPVTLGERIVAARCALGLPRKRLAQRIGVDEGTLMRWETGEWTPTRLTRPKLDAFLSAVHVTS